MSTGTMRLGLRLCQGRPATVTLTTTPSSTSFLTISSANLLVRRNISSRISSCPKRPCLARDPPPSTTATAAASSFFTPSLCRTRRSASTSAETIQSNPSQSPQNTLLDWNTFFRLRTSRRRYSLVSSIVTSIGTTAGTFIFLSTQPDLADEITKLVPTDPFVSMGIFTFGATLFGWLIGPFFGNAVWRMFHRAKLPEFTTKEKAFFERIKRHRVNPTGASTNNPVPDYYGEKIGSVAGYRRWLKDQRAFNRKREGTYTASV